MIRDITLGQFYPVDSVIHRMDPRTKLFGTMAFIISLFLADHIGAYVVATGFWRWRSGCPRCLFRLLSGG